MNDSPYDLICIGGGAAGVFSAISTAELANDSKKIAILEATARPMTKIKISGGGRCNVTHNCFNPKELIKNYPRGQKFLLNCFYHFGPEQMLQWLRNNGVETHIEKDGRIFPVSNNSQTIIDCFNAKLAEYAIPLLKGQMVKSVEKSADIFKITTKNATFTTRHLVIATGSAPIGHELARSMGHNITELAPSLFTLKSTDPVVTDMAGVSVQKTSVRLQVNNLDHKISGPVLITHWGFSGPAILKLSAFAARELKQSNYAGHLHIDWLPDLKPDQLLYDLMQQKHIEPKKKIINVNPTSLPNRLWQKMAVLNGLADLTWADAAKKDLQRLADAIKLARYLFAGKGEFKEEFVTCGGVDLSEIDPKNLQSKITENLFFAGEILDIDGITGGFNFQNAWSGSRAIAQYIAGKDRN